MEGFSPLGAMLFAYAETPSEWERLQNMRLSDAAAWVAKKRITPS